jgi:hypothetical protein
MYQKLNETMIEHIHCGPPSSQQADTQPLISYRLAIFRYQTPASGRRNKCNTVPAMEEVVFCTA